MNINEAQAVIAEISSTWPQRVLDDGQVVVWMDTLRGISLEVARAAVHRLRESLNFPPSHAEFLAAARDETRRKMAARSLPAGALPPCPECNDDEWVVLGGRQDVGVVPTVRPCSRCLPVQFVRWQGGHLRGGHKCGECADLLHGSAADRRSALAAIRERLVPVDLDPAF